MLITRGRDIKRPAETQDSSMVLKYLYLNDSFRSKGYFSVHFEADIEKTKLKPTALINSFYIKL